jgi:hypothetical protein
MSTSIVIAQVLGIGFTVLGLSMLFNKNWTAAVVDEIIKSKAMQWIGGLIALSMGAVIVVLNNQWTSGLPLYVTILGWLTLAKGAAILIFPNMSISYYKKMNRGNIFMWGGLFVLVLAVVFLYYGYM